MKQKKHKRESEGVMNITPDFNHPAARGLFRYLRALERWEERSERDRKKLLSIPLDLCV